MDEVTVLTSKICVMKVIITSTFVYIFELESLELYRYVPMSYPS